MPDQKQEHLRRLRERQLADRDPHVKPRQFHLFWPSPWAFPSSLAAIVVLASFGVVVGRAIDTRENIKDLIR